MTTTEPGYAERYATWIAYARPLFEAHEKGTFTGYPYVINDSAPLVPLRKPLAEATILPITSGGLYLAASQEPFDAPNFEGDQTYRTLPTRLAQDEIAIAHGHYDPAEALRDYNAVFPLDRLRELAAAGQFAGLTDDGFSFMGYVTDAGTFAAGTAQAIARAVVASGADAAILVPV